MKKTLAILLSAVMVLALLAGCGEQKQPDTNDQGNTDASELNVGVFYYDFSDVYISSVRNFMNSQLDARTVPLNHKIASRTVRAVQQQVKDHSAGIVLNLKIMMSVSIRIDEDFKIIVIINNGVTLRQTGLNIRLFQYCAYIQTVDIPQHFRLGIIFGLGETFPTDIPERRGGLSQLPGGFIRPAVYLYFLCRTIAYITFGQGQHAGMFLKQALCPGRKQGAPAQ